MRAADQTTMVRLEALGSGRYILGGPNICSIPADFPGEARRGGDQ